MSEIQKNGFTGYEYYEITVPRIRASLYLDGYESFGWQTDGHYKLPESGDAAALHLRRDRKILNKMELTRLQRNFEASMKEIDALENRKTAKPLAAALAVGLAGTAFMAGSTFAVTASPPIVWLCVLLAIPGLIGWTLPHFLFRRMSERRAEIVKPLIEAKYDEIYELCKKGSALL